MPAEERGHSERAWLGEPGVGVAMAMRSRCRGRTGSHRRCLSQSDQTHFGETTETPESEDRGGWLGGAERPSGSP